MCIRDRHIDMQKYPLPTCCMYYVNHLKIGPKVGKMLLILWKNADIMIVSIRFWATFCEKRVRVK